MALSSHAITIRFQRSFAMVFLKLLFYHPYTIRVKTSANRCATPKSLAHTIEISCLFPHGSCGDTTLRHFGT